MNKIEIKICECVHVYDSGGGAYWKLCSLVVWLKKLQNPVVLLWILRVSSQRPAGSVWWGWEWSRVTLFALVRQRSCATSWMWGSGVPVIFSSVLTTLCRDFQSKALQAPDHTDMHAVSKFSIELLYKVVSMRGGRWALLNRWEKVQALLRSLYKRAEQGVCYLYPQKLDAAHHFHCVVGDEK